MAVGTYEKVLQRNNYLEHYTETFKDEVQRLMQENRNLSQDIENKNTATENLMNIINNKSQENGNLLEEIEHRDSENNKLLKQLQDLQEKCEISIDTLVKEKMEAMTSLHLARQESKELLIKIKEYDDVIHKNNDISKTLEAQVEDYNELKKILLNTIEENENLQIKLTSLENNNSTLLKEIQRLHEINDYSIKSINILQDERNQYKTSYELTKTESDILVDKVSNVNNLTDKLERLRNEHEKVLEEKQLLQNELLGKNLQLDNAIHSIEVTRKESGNLMEKIHGAEKLKDDIFQVNQDYQKLTKEKQLLQEDFAEKRKEIQTLQQTLDHLKKQNDNLLKISENENVLEKQLTELKKTYDDLIAENKLLQNDFDTKTNNLHDTLESKIDENRELDKKIKFLELQKVTTTNNMKVLQTEKLAAQISLDAIKKESTELIDKLEKYNILKKEFRQLKQDHEATKKEKEYLQKELNNNTAKLVRLTTENNELQSQSQTLLVHSQSLENTLLNARSQNVINSECIQKDYTNILAQIEDMKKEKRSSAHKIRELLDKLDESENIIANLSEDMLARDDRIAILENHINELEEEVKRLHDCLTEVVNTGEEIKKHSYEKIDRSLKRMEAHHSKATHNIKMDVAKLLNKNMKLEDQLSVTKSKTEETLMDQNKYISQIIHLENEREVIVDDIKQLELNNVGDSALAPTNCNLKDILTSLNRIRKFIDAKCSKSTSLEQTLLKVQTSSQLLLSKADEAKRIIEKEKHKIISEKEEAIRDRHNMESQLENLKKTLEQKISRDQGIITDLEAEILNKQLIIDKINKTTQQYISKLETELQSLQDLYKNSTDKITELQEEIINRSKDKNNDMEAIKKCKITLENKFKEIVNLQNELQAWKNKPRINIGIQTTAQLQNNVASQTEPYTKYERSGIEEKNISDVEKSRHSIPLSDKTKLPKQIPPLMNEVQVLTANIEPTFDYVKSSYLNYKMKRLTPGRLEHYSISNISDKSNSECTPRSDLNAQIYCHSADRIPDKPTISYGSPTVHNKLIDIYNRKSMHTNSSKLIENEKFCDTFQNQVKPSGFAEFEINCKNVQAEKTIIERRKDNEITAESTSNKSTDKDLFVIYQDSVSSNTPRMYGIKSSTQKKGHSELFVEAFTVHPTGDGKIYETQNKKYIKNDSFSYKDHENEDDSVKYKLKINLPRVQNDSPSVIASSEDDKISLDSYQLLGIYPSPRIISSSTTDINCGSENIIQETPSLPAIINNDCQDLEYNESQGVVSGKETLGITIKKQAKRFHSDRSKQSENKSTSSPRTKHLNVQMAKGHKPKKRPDKKESESHHRLSRVGADVLLIKADDYKISDDDYNPVKELQLRNFGLDYILNSVQHEINPLNDMNISDFTVGISKIRGEEERNQIQYRKENASTNSKLDYDKITTGKKTESTINLSSDDYQSKTFIDKSVMVVLDTYGEHARKIQYLTNLLNNAEKDFKKKMDVIKVQYDINIKSIMNEHNEGVKSIQSLHEETLHDILKNHENEVENLRSMSIEAMRKAEKLEKENRKFKMTIQEYNTGSLDEEPVKMTISEVKRRRRSREVKELTKTTVEAFDVKPKTKYHGPCTCSLDLNLTDTIRHIFEQVDVEQRKVAEHTYMKYIASKILNENIESLDAQELSFLHLKVCRIWKIKLTKEEVLQKRIDSLQNELMSKRHAQQLSKLDREVAEERRRLQELRDAVCRNTLQKSRAATPVSDHRAASPTPPSVAVERDLSCSCQSGTYNLEVGERRSAGDLLPTTQSIRIKRTKTESNRAVLAKLDIEDQREKKLYNDEPPTRLRKSHDRHVSRVQKKKIR